MEEKKSGRKLSLNRVWDRIAALTGVSKSTAQKILWRRRRHMTSSNSQSNHRHLPSKVSLGVSLYCLKKVLSTLDNTTRTELKQSIGYTGSMGLFRKDLLHMKFAYTGCGVNQKVLMERQGVVLSRIIYPRRARKLREAGNTVGYT